MCDEIRRIFFGTAFQRDIGTFGKHHHRVLSAPGDALRIATQRRFDQFAQPRLGRLQLPLSLPHDSTFST